jgi:serine/threonine protein kinase
MLKKLFKMTVLGIQHCHQEGFMHRDIKPENILLSVGENGEILDLKIADFGMVCTIGSQGVEDEYGTVGY